ncbi:hypothetical protein HDU67_004249 [Dinochytrium kinnereticum]|nr:hypothetical protein HDU67_004249 [Dinochytrium kinnereticum]
MSNPFELDFEFQLEQYVLKAPKAPAAKLKWDKQRTLWKVASEKSPISRPKVLTISRHHFSTPKKSPECLLPMLPQRPITKPAPKEHTSDSSQPTDSPANAETKLPPAPVSQSSKPVTTKHPATNALVPLADGHKPMASNLKSAAFSASYNAYASSLPANYLPLHMRKIHAEVFQRLAEPKKVLPPPLPEEMRHKTEKRVSKALFERLHNESRIRELARIEERETEVKRVGGRAPPKGFFERLAIPKTKVVHYKGKEDGETNERKIKKKKSHYISEKDLNRLATPRYRVVLASKKKDPKTLRELEEDEDIDDEDLDVNDDETTNESPPKSPTPPPAPQNQSSPPPKSHTEKKAKPPTTKIKDLPNPSPSPPSSPPSKPRAASSYATSRTTSSESFSVSSGSRPISRKEPLPAIPPGSRGSLKREAEAEVGGDEAGVDPFPEGREGETREGDVRNEQVEGERQGGGDEYGEKKEGEAGVAVGGEHSEESTVEGDGNVAEGDRDVISDQNDQAAEVHHGEEVEDHYSVGAEDNHHGDPAEEHQKSAVVEEKYVELSEEQPNDVPEDHQADGSEEHQGNITHEHYEEGTESHGKVLDERDEETTEARCAEVTDDILNDISVDNPQEHVESVPEDHHDDIPHHHDEVESPIVEEHSLKDDNDEKHHHLADDEAHHEDNVEESRNESPEALHDQPTEVHHEDSSEEEVAERSNVLVGDDVLVGDGEGLTQEGALEEEAKHE